MLKGKGLWMFLSGTAHVFLFCFHFYIVCFVFFCFFFFYHDYEWLKFAHSVENCHAPRWSEGMSVLKKRVGLKGGKSERSWTLYFVMSVQQHMECMCVRGDLGVEWPAAALLARKDPSLPHSSSCPASSFWTSVYRTTTLRELQINTDQEWPLP